jgi:hypothetical protein
MIAGILDRAWAYLLAAGAAIAVVCVAWRRGAQSTSVRVNATTAEAKSRMLDAAVAAPKEKDRVVEDLRSGRL